MDVLKVIAFHQFISQVHRIIINRITAGMGDDNTVGLNLLQYGFSKACPMVYLLRKLGVPESRG